MFKDVRRTEKPRFEKNYCRTDKNHNHQKPYIRSMLPPEYIPLTLWQQQEDAIHAGIALRENVELDEATQPTPKLS